MQIKLVPWEDVRISSLNGRWTKDGKAEGKQRGEEVEPEYGIYIMQSMRENEVISSEIGKEKRKLKAKYVYRIGGIGVRRAFGSEKGNSARKRLAQCNKSLHATGLKAARNWRYIFGASISVQELRADQLAFLAASAESLLQHQFTRKFEYLGYSHFNCKDAGDVKNQAKQFVDMFNKKVAPLFS